MGLALRLRISDALLQNVLRLFYELSMQIDGVAVDPAHRIIFAKDIVRGLLVVGIGGLTVSLPFFGEFMGGCAITTLIGVARLTIRYYQWGLGEGVCPRTRSNRDDFFACSCRARPRRRSYSASALLLW
jgi:hypothetical protein